MGTWLGGEQKVAAPFHQFFAERLVCKQIIGQIDRTQMLVTPKVLPNPALGRVQFAVLLVAAILRTDELRTQRQHAVVAIGYHGGAQHVMRIFGSMFAFASAALRALNLLGVMKLRSIECDENASVEMMKIVQSLILMQIFHRMVENRIQLLTVAAIQGVADVIVRRNAVHAEQRLTGVAVVCFVKALLMMQERR